MKADLTRNTFDPLKHFDRVLMQQGRVQLDADWNEQAAILSYYLRKLAADLIGPVGGPGPNPGFAISAIPSTTGDFQIGFGDYYVDGLLCEADFVPIAIFPTSTTATTNVFQVMNWSSDFELQTIPPFELFDDTPGSTNAPVPVLITPVKGSKTQITVTKTDNTGIPNYPNPKLRRWITYLQQPDYVFSTKQGAISPPPLTPNADLQIYLDVWERVITYAEDDSIREVALGGPDTAVRGKRVWQVKWCKALDGAACMVPQQLYQQFQPANRGWLQARAKQGSASTDPCIINPDSAYTGPENQLYRVEINRGGQADSDPVNSATFKWSRENGSVFFPIASGGGTQMVVVESLGRDDRFGISEGDLVEVQDDRSVLLNDPNSPPNLLTVQSIDPGTRTVTLAGTVDQNLGSDTSLHPLLRRWDQTAGDPAEFGLTLANDNAAFVQEGTWLTLEDGVQIQFQPASSDSPNQYRTGDYWLIPARTATGDVEWPKVLGPDGNPETDADGNAIPIALPPHGVTHHYAPLAVVTVTATGSVTRDHECRSSFNLRTAPLPDK